MRYVLTVILLIAFCFVNAQATKGVIYNFQTDYYWDSTLYKSSMAFYYDLKNGKIYQSNYSVKVYEHSKVIKDSPLVTKDFYYPDTFKYEPFCYKKIKDSISIIFFDHKQNRLNSHVDYILDNKDSVSFMLDKSVLIGQQSKYGMQYSGESKYLGVKTVIVKNKLRPTYCFKENNKIVNPDVRFYNITEVYIDTATLVPLQFISRRYNMKDVYTNYFSVTKIQTITNNIPKYAYQKDLTLYEDVSVVWTNKQRQTFLNKYAKNPKDENYIKCIINVLDGQVSFYNIELNPGFIGEKIKNKCDGFMSN